jgi:opacity protein-like surface antigen
VPLGVTVRYASGDGDGKCIDTDWEHPADPSLWLRTESDCTADSDIWSADVGWWLSFGGSHPERGIELFAGYVQQRVHFDVENILILEDPYDLYSWDTFTGDVSTWDLEIEAAKVGARTALPLGKGFSVNAELAVLIGRARGEGNWKLREYTFEQKSDGTGVDALLGLEFAPTKNLAIQAGGRYYKFKGGAGVEDGQQPDYEYWHEGFMDDISISQLGWFVGVQLRF